MTALEAGKLLIDGGAFLLMAWLVFNTFTKTLPTIVNQFTSALRDQRDQFSEDLKEQRDITISSWREHQTRCTGAINSNTKTLNELAIEIAKQDK